MNVWKKIGALTFVLIVALALSVSAFATSTPADMKAGENNDESGKIGEFTNPDITTQYDTNVVLYKEITAYNKDAVTVNAPTITYKYTIAAGSGGKEIYDVKSAHTPNANVHATTKAGVGTPTITASTDGSSFSETSGTLAFTPATVQFNASNEGTANYYKLNVDFSSINFTTGGSGAGVYRYEITEHVNESTTTSDDTSAKNAAGITEGTISNTRYLDVYVDGDGHIYGYVCFAYDNNIDERDDPTPADTVAKAYKTSGFVAGTDSSTSTAVTADAYYTFNFEVTKVVENDNYAITTHHKFPFTVTLYNATVTANVLPIMTFTDDTSAGTPTYNETATNVEQTALAPAALGTQSSPVTWSPKISHHTAVKYVGVPCGTVVTIKETNDVSSVTYKATIAGANTNGDARNIYTNEDSNNAILNATNALEAASANFTGASAVTFTNALQNISPTGVTLRYAPYFLTLGAGVVALPLTRSYRRREED